MNLIFSLYLRHFFLTAFLGMAFSTWAQTPLVWDNGSPCDFWVRYRYAPNGQDPCQCTGYTSVAVFLPANTVITGGSVPAGNHMCITSLWTNNSGSPGAELCTAECVDIGGIATYEAYCENICGSYVAEISGYSVKVYP